MEIVALSFSGQMPWLTLPLAFEERNMQGRIKNMQKTKKSSAVLVIAAMLLAVLISAGCSVKPSASPVANTPSELTPPETAVDSNMQTEAPIEPTETPPAAETTPASPAEPTETPSTTEAPAEAAELPSTQATPKDIAYSYDNSFLLRLPSDWEGRYTVGYNEQAEGVIFSNKANADAGWSGMLFNIFSYEAGEWAEIKDEFYRETPVQFYEMGEASGRVYILTMPGDVNYNPNDEALLNEYNDMAADIESVVASFTPMSEIPPPVTEVDATGAYTLAGYVDYDDNALYLDEVEIVYAEDAERLAELGLTVERDAPSGYHIRYLGKERQTFTLTDETVYTWTDIALDFGVDPEGDRVYSTVNREEFERYRSRDYYDSTDLAYQIPLLVTVRDGTVVSVEERFMFTI